MTLIGLAWWLGQRWWIGLPVTLGIGMWWWLFLVVVPSAYRQSGPWDEITNDIGNAP